MAQLNFPDPNTTTTYTEAGITWTYNATLGVWSSDIASSGGGGFSGDYNDLTNKPTIPTDNAELTNGAGYITDVDLDGYVTDADLDGYVLAAGPTGEGIRNCSSFETFNPGNYLNTTELRAGYVNGGNITAEYGIQVGNTFVDDDGYPQFDWGIDIRHNYLIQTDENDVEYFQSMPGITQMVHGSWRWEITESAISFGHQDTYLGGTWSEGGFFIDGDADTQQFNCELPINAPQSTITAKEFIGDGSKLTNLPSGGGGLVEPVTFTEVTTHEAGVSVTGGDVVQSAAGGSFIASSSGVNFGDVGYTGSQQRHNGRFVSYADYTAANFGPLYEFYQTNGTVSRQFAVGLSSGTPYVFTDGTNPISAPSTIPLGISPQVNFDQLTEHAGGVSVTGGQSNISGDSLFLTCPNVQFRGASTDPDPFCANFALHNKADSTDACAIKVSQGASNGFDRPSYKGINILDIKTNDAGKIRYGIYSNLGVGAAGENYNFYAAGGAPNYFAGELLSANDPANVPGQNRADNGVRIKPDGTVVASKGTHEPAGNPSLYLRRSNASANGNWRAIEMYAASATSATGFIKINGSVARSIDSRLGATGVAMADGAADIVKLLQPKVITQGGETFNGFLPTDLAGTFAAAVDGTAGATLAIGTYTDPEGVVETDVEEPEAIPFGATWVQTGTRDVMQGVSRGELIPLLTKALQEALTRIETLEADVASLQNP